MQHYAHCTVHDTRAPDFRRDHQLVIQIIAVKHHLHDNMNGQTDNRPIRIVRVSHMRYKHADIAKTQQFLKDFGMREVYTVNKSHYFAGEGPDPYVYIAEEVRFSPRCSDLPLIRPRRVGGHERVSGRGIPRGEQRGSGKSESDPTAGYETRVGRACGWIPRDLS